MSICEHFSKIDFLIVSDLRGDRYLSDAFGHMKNIVHIGAGQRSAPMCNYIAHADFQSLALKIDL